MEDILKIGDDAYGFPEKNKVKTLDTNIFETERMGAILDGIIDKLERMVPPGRTMALMNPDQRKAAREELINARDLYSEFAYRYDECIEKGQPLVDAPALSDEVQSMTMEKILKLSDFNERLGDRLTVLAIRMGAEADGSSAT